MKKAFLFLPAAVYTIAAITLNICLDAFSSLWYTWAALLWLGGFLLNSGRGWGGLFGLIPAVHLLYMSTQSTGQVINIEQPLGIVTAVYVMASVVAVWKNRG